MLSEHKEISKWNQSKLVLRRQSTTRPWNQHTVGKSADSSWWQVLLIWVRPLKPNTPHLLLLPVKKFICSIKCIAKIILSGKLVVMLIVRTWNNVDSYLVHNSPSDSHAIKDSNINNGWHPSVIYGLRTIGPHVGTFCQVNIAWTQTKSKETGGKIKKKKHSRGTGCYTKLMYEKIIAKTCQS